MLLRDEAIALLAAYGRGAAWTQHCLAVADAAARVGSVLQGRRPIDLERLWSAALLHDLGRCVTHDPVLHGVEGYRLLIGLGHEDEAYVCASHVLFGLEAAEAAQHGLPPRNFVPVTTEERLVPLVDYLVDGSRPTTLDERFSSLRSRNADNAFFVGRLDRAYAAASSFMAELGREVGESIEKLVASRD